MAPPAPRGRGWAARCALAALAVAALAGGAHAQAFTCGAADAAAICAALGELYAATGGADWYNNDGWRDAAAGTATGLCSFYGVSCEDGAVTSLCVHGMRAAAATLAPALFSRFADSCLLAANAFMQAQDPHIQQAHGHDPGLARLALKPFDYVRAHAGISSLHL
jgi:hypothetical protein